MHKVRTKTFKLAWATISLTLCFFQKSTFAQDIAKLNDSVPVKISGSLGTNMVFYGVNGIEARQAPYSIGFNANATLTAYQISMPFSFTYYNHESVFQQPFNQFGLSPSYKWATLHLGYRSLSFSEFTLNGQTFLGAGVELNPENYHFAFIYGKFNKNSDNDPYAADSMPQFTRKGWAMKLGYGTSSNFVDFSILRIGDNTDNYIQPPDTLLVPTPEQNLVMGITSKLLFFNKLSFDVDGSVSFYTDDRNGQPLNEIPDQWLTFSNKFIDINQTSEHYMAIKSNLTYKFTNKISTGIGYRRISPSYRSMGAYFFNSDIEQITINQTYAFYKNKINIKGSLGLQRDNLENTKKSTSKRTVGSLNFSYDINKTFGVNAVYTNFTTNQKAGMMPIIDSLKLYQTNRSISIVPRFTKVSETRSNVVVLVFNSMKLDDKNKSTENRTETNTNILNLNYVIGFIPNKLNLNFGLTYTNLKNSAYTNTISGAMAGISKVFFEDKLSLNWNNSFMFNKVNSDKGKIFNSSLSANYKIGKRHTFNLNFNYINNIFDEQSTTPSFNEYRGDFSYVFTF